MKWAYFPTRTRNARMDCFIHCSVAVSCPSFNTYNCSPQQAPWLYILWRKGNDPKVTQLLSDNRLDRYPVTHLWSISISSQCFRGPAPEQQPSHMGGASVYQSSLDPGYLAPHVSAGVAQGHLCTDENQWMEDAEMQISFSTSTTFPINSKSFKKDNRVPLGVRKEYILCSWELFRKREDDPFVSHCKGINRPYFINS